MMVVGGWGRTAGGGVAHLNWEQGRWPLVVNPPWLPRSSGCARTSWEKFKGDFRLDWVFKIVVVAREDVFSFSVFRCQCWNKRFD